MITALDTNILLDVILPNEPFYAGSAAAIQDPAGSVVVCDIVCAEVCLQFESRKECDGFLGELEATVERLSRDSLFLAGRAWRTYRHEADFARSRIL